MMGQPTPVLNALLTAQAAAGIVVGVTLIVVSPPLWGSGLDVVEGTMGLLRAYGPEIKGCVVLGWTGYSACLFGVGAWREIAKLGRR